MLQLVLGRSGTGKTKYTVDEICGRISAGEENILLLVPEQFSFVSGNVFLSRLGDENFNKVEISDFTRLSYEVRRLYGGVDKTVLDDSGKAILMSRAISAVQDSLRLYTKNRSSAGLITAMTDLYSELRTCDIGFFRLEELSATCTNETLKNKLYDISCILSAYESLIADEFIDSDTELIRLYEKLMTVDYFQGRTVYIDGFNGFTQQEIKILSRIFKGAQDVYITLCTDSVHDAQYGYGVFSNVKETAVSLMRLANECGIKTAPALVLDRMHRSEGSALALLEKGLYNPEKETDQTPCEMVTLCRADTIYDECAYIAAEIKKLLRSGKYRCRDIAVLSRDAEVYKAPLEAAFENYEIPFFHDERQAVVSQPLVNLIEFALKAVTHSYRSEDIFSYAKTNLVSVSNEEICSLENYAVLWRISGNQWKQEFTKHPNGFSSEFTQEDRALLHRLNGTREKVVLPLLKLEKDLRGASGAAAAKAVYEFLIHVHADKNLKKYAQRLERQQQSVLAQEQGRIWDLVMQVLDQMALTLGNEPVAAAEFANLFSLVIRLQDLGNIPQGLDNVSIGSAERMKLDNPPVVFIAGANEGIFPRNYHASGLLNESDREYLKNAEIDLFANGRRMAVQEKFIAYCAVTACTKRLFVSCCTASANGEAMTESSLITEIQEILPNCRQVRTADFDVLERIGSSTTAFELCASLWKENSVLSQSLKQYFRYDELYKDKIRALEFQCDEKDFEIENSETATALFGRELYLSASRADVFYNCPFMYFCRFGMEVRPRKVAEMDPMQTGTVIHYVFERLFSEYTVAALCAMDDKVRLQTVNAVLSEYLEQEMGMHREENKRFTYLFLRLQKVINLVVERMIEDFSNSSFEPDACELPIDRDGDIKPLEVPLDDGGRVIVRGSVDRVDLMEADGKKYIRIVDYKTGQKVFDLNDIVNGLNMQMMIYMICIQEGASGKYEGALPAGVMYMPSGRNLPQMSRDAGDDEVKKEICRDLKFSGVVLDDTQVLSGMDHMVTDEMIESGKYRGITGKLVTLRQFGLLSSVIKGLLREMGEVLHRGDIGVRPVQYSAASKHMPCDFCDYTDVCENKQKKHPRKITDKKYDEVLRELAEEGEE